jgi:hypothetical protein
MLYVCGTYISLDTLIEALILLYYVSSGSGFVGNVRKVNKNLLN